MAGGQFPNQGRLLDRHGAEDHPVEADRQQGLGPLKAPHPAAELHRDGERRHDRPHHGIVHRFATAGSVEIHQVEPFGSLPLPGQGLGHRIA